MITSSPSAAARFTVFFSAKDVAILSNTSPISLSDILASSFFTPSFLKSPSLISGIISAVAVYSTISSGTYLVTLTFGSTKGDFSFLEKASITVARTAASTVSAFRSFSGINFFATSTGTLPLRNPST